MKKGYKVIGMSASDTGQTAQLVKEYRLDSHFILQMKQP